MIVTLPYDPAWKALEWAKDHCPDYVTNEVHPTKHGFARFRLTTSFRPSEMLYFLV